MDSSAGSPGIPARRPLLDSIMRPSVGSVGNPALDGLTLEFTTVDLAEHPLELLLDFQHFSVGFPRLQTSELTSVERMLECMMAGFGRWNSRSLHPIPYIEFANLRAILCWKSRMPELKLRESQHE